MPLSRRALLAAAALGGPALVAGRALGQVPASGEVDVAIVGAGAAGIAAARRIAQHSRSYALLEAAERPGGRAITDTGRFGVPCDLGARWLHGPARNPLVAVARAARLDVYDAPTGQRVRVGTRDGRDPEVEDFAGAVRRAHRAIVTAGESPRDVAASRVVPDLGEWTVTATTLLGPLALGKDLDEVSSVDFARAEERVDDAFCRQGLGAILAIAAIPLAVQTRQAVGEIDLSGRAGVVLKTASGTVRARAVILTASTSVVVAGALKVTPALPPALVTACQRLSLGSTNRIVLELAGNPLRARDDEAISFKTADARSMAVLARVAGTDLAFCDVGGRFGRELEQAGEAAMVAFAAEFLARHYGADVKKRIGRSHATRWGAEPFVLGGMSVAPPGQQPARRALMQPVENRLFYAGEAAHETLWGTVGGAWLSGERAADQALRALGVALPGAAASPAPPPGLAPPAAATTPPARETRREREERLARERAERRRQGPTPSIIAPSR